jgi:hypothetical protein
MTDEERDDKLPYAEKIAKLLRMAESTDNEAEADAFNAKAQSLMITYAITEELLAQAEGRQVQDEIVKQTITYTGVLSPGLFDIGAVIARANNCKVLITKHQNADVTLIVVGFQTDVTNVKVLNASLQVQASTAMQRWYREQDISYRTKMEKFKMRRTFLMSFAQGLGAKLERAKHTGVENAVKDEAARTGGDIDTAQKSTDLVLRTKTERVNDWLDQEYGSTLRSVKRSYSSGGYDAKRAGFAAGVNSDVGNPRISSSRGQIEK